MPLSFFKKIDSDQYPKIVQKWSFTAYFAMPVFTIGNKLYGYFAVILGASLVNFLIFILQLEGVIYDIIYVISFAVSLFIVLYLIMYGRILAWKKLGYNNSEQDILKFKNRQRAILFWAWAYYIALISIALFLGLNYPNWYFLNN